MQEDDLIQGSREPLAISTSSDFKSCQDILPPDMKFSIKGDFDGNDPARSSGKFYISTKIFTKDDMAALPYELSAMSLEEKREQHSRPPSPQALKKQDFEKIITLNEFLVDESILSREIKWQCPEILHGSHIARLGTVYRREKPGSQSDNSLSSKQQSSYFSPLNTVSPPGFQVVESRRSKYQSDPSFFHGIPRRPIPTMHEAPLVQASIFFEHFDIKKIGPYIMSKSLGSGSTSKVKLGIHESTGEKLAVKIIPRDPPPVSNRISERKYGDEPTASVVPTGASGNASLAKESRLLREISLMSLLYHPHIATMYGFSVTPACFVLFMEYVEGGPLLNYIVKNGRLKEDRARHFFRQLLSAVSYLHSNAIVHRDLKIENILIDCDGNLKLIDFGLSNFYSGDPLAASASVQRDRDYAKIPLKLSTFCGSLYYAAPELLHGRPYYGPEIDIWSLGVILYVLVTGKVPFDDVKLPMLHEKIKRGNVEYPLYLGKSLVELLNTMLQVDPGRRATIADLLGASWTLNSCSVTNSDTDIDRQSETRPVPDRLLSTGLPLPRVPTFLPARTRLVVINTEVLFGVCSILGKKYSPWLLKRLYSHFLLDWDSYKMTPLVMLYYLVEEKMARWRMDQEAQRYMAAYKKGSNLCPNKKGIIPTDLGLFYHGRLMASPLWDASVVSSQKPPQLGHHSDIGEKGKGSWLKSLLPPSIHNIIHGSPADSSKSTNSYSTEPICAASGSQPGPKMTSLDVQNFHSKKDLPSYTYLIGPDLSAATISLSSRHSLSTTRVVYKNPYELKEDLEKSFALLGLQSRFDPENGLLCTYSPSLEQGGPLDDAVLADMKMTIYCQIVKLAWIEGGPHAVHFSCEEEKATRSFLAPNSLMKNNSPKDSCGNSPKSFLESIGSGGKSPSLATANKKRFQKIILEIIKSTVRFCQERLERSIPQLLLND